MPIFDYKCANCRKRFSLLVGMVAEKQEEICPTCGSSNVNRLISRFSRLRSEDDIIDSLADPSNIGDLDDPREMRSWMKRMGKEMGEDLGDDFDEVLEDIGSGEQDES
jgi:putative FmdB family regulatory protein